MLKERPAEKYVDLFWSKVAKQPGDGCWLWTGKPGNGNGGYGRTQVAPRRTELAHRVSYVIAFGPIEADDCVLHHCDTPLCVRPEHLFKGDRGDNARDMASKGRQWLQRTPERARRVLPRACVNCGDVVTRVVSDRCINCYNYWWRVGVDRPPRLFLRPSQRRTNR